jgi:phospholipid/cholesterol/gamma-HCH transport system ATP-binding protein
MKNLSSNIDFETPIITISDLEKSFGLNKVLQGLNLELFKGENFVVLGRSGSGKSVLIKIISGLIKADKGKVVVLGKELNQINQNDLFELRTHLGFSFQNSALYDSMSVRQNLEFPLVRHQKGLGKKEINKIVQTVLEDVGLLDTLNQMPSELSGGQRKRIGIARTLILHPEIMLYDEPTSGLDPISSMEINHLINEVQTKFKTSSIIITHDLTCAKTTGNRMAVILEGKFSKQGTFNEIFESDDPSVKPFYDYNFIN